MSSIRKINANRENAKKSCGPRTAAGKKHSCGNSFRHGFFSRELRLSDSDKLEFDALTQALMNDDPPTTTRQHLAVQDIAHCLWRCKTAARLESRCVEALMKEDEEDEGETDNAVDPANIASLYSHSPQDLRKAIKWFKHILLDFERNSVMRAEWRVHFDRLFGPDFWISLESWTGTSTSLDAAILADHFVRHAKIFNKPLKPLPTIEGAPRVIIDRLQGEQMRAKLLHFQLRHMVEFSGGWEQRERSSTYPGARAADFSPRHYTAAVRDYHRAVNFFWALKERESPPNSSNEPDKSN